MSEANTKGILLTGGFADRDGVSENFSDPSDRERREFPRLQAAFDLRFAVCGGHGSAVQGYTNSISLGGFSFTSRDREADVGDHVTVEIAVPGFDKPLYFLGVVMRVEFCPDNPDSRMLAVRFDWLGKTDRYREKLAVLTGAHQEA